MATYRDVVADQRGTPNWPGLGISFGAGFGLVVGLIGWGGGGIALGLAFGASAGLVVGASVQSMRGPLTVSRASEVRSSLRRMALTQNQAILTVTTKGAEVAKAIVALEALLESYPEARIISLTHNIDQLAGLFSAKTTLLAVVEYTPSRSGDAATE